MMANDLVLPQSLRSQIGAAIQQARTQIRWKPGKAQPHLEKRIRLGHLPPATTLAEYESVIRSIVQQTQAEVYGFYYDHVLYPTVVAPHQGRLWLVMIGLNGVMETAFPPDDPIIYFQNPKYRRLGLVEEFLA